MSSPVVSVICITYNHEKYISQALESFVSQKTNFKFEIIVYDDASTDSTADIIRKYERKYPDIIKPIYQTENQYSKGTKVTRKFAVPKAQGKYLAFCEGDDYWIDNSKLQLEYDIMEKNPNLSMCTHGFECLRDNSGFVDKKIGKEGLYNSLDILGNNAPIMHTSTRLIKTSIYKSMPEFFFSATVGDLPLLLWSTLNGNVYYIERIMSAYRLLSSNSWSKRLFQDKEFALKNLHSIIEFYNQFNEYTNFNYDDLIKNRIDKECFGNYYICGMYKQAKKTNMYKRQNLKTKIIINFGILFPKLIHKLRQYKNINNQ